MPTLPFPSTRTALRLGLFVAWLLAVVNIIGVSHQYSSGEAMCLLWIAAIGLHVTHKEAQ